MLPTHALLLTTKIHPPHIRATHVVRPRLSVQLEQALHHQLTLISAPAGSGKTTLFSAWLLQCSTPFAWVALDESDNDPVRFISYCIAALRTLSPTIGETTLTLLQTSETLEVALIPLLNELIHLLPDDFLLILDDYHFIHQPIIHHAMTFLLEHLPTHMHLIIISRIDPPLPCAHLRARGELNELRLTNLRFTSEEVTSFCQQVMDLHLTPEQIATLEEHTEGWIAGLQLATLSLQGCQNATEVATFVRSFSGRDRYVLDYLLEEVLQRLPSPLQEFLLNTSILDRLSPSLCAAVHNQPGPLLEDLERANLFLIPLDNERIWYRYHHLFSELLHTQLLQCYPERETLLSQRAAEWYEQNTMPIEAVHYALAAKDFTRVARLISEVAEDMLKRGEAATVATWLKHLPKQFLDANPVLNLACAFTLLATSHFEQTEPYLQAAEQDLQCHEDPTHTNADHLLGRVYAAQATVAINQDEYNRAIKLSHQALKLLPAEDKSMRAILLLNLADAYKATGNLAQAEPPLHESILLNQTVGNLLVMVTAMGSLGKLQEQQGLLQEAEKTYRLALRLSDEQVEHGGQELPSAGKVHIFLSHLLYKWNGLEEALEHVNRGIQLCHQWEHIPHLLDGYLILAKIQQARHLYEAAQATLAEAQALIEKERLATLKPNQKLHNMTLQVQEAFALSLSLPPKTAPALAAPLNKREQEILRLVATGMSNREIAHTLVMTIGTIKWYVNSIYGKLHVHGRVQAVERARALHLLPLS